MGRLVVVLAAVLFVVVLGDTVPAHAQMDDRKKFQKLVKSLKDLKEPAPVQHETFDHATLKKPRFVFHCLGPVVL
jgi:hypothetical protein